MASTDGFLFLPPAGPLPELTIETLWAGSFSLTSPIAARSRMSTTGWRRPAVTSSHTASSSYWWATSVTWRHSVRCVARMKLCWSIIVVRVKWNKAGKKCHLDAFDPAGDPARSREAGGGVWDALHRDVRPRCHQRGACLHRADQRHLRLGAVWRHHNPGGLGGREEWICAQRGSFVRGGHQEWPPLSLLIWEEFWTTGTKVFRGVKALEGRCWWTEVSALWWKLLVTLLLFP